MLARDHDLTVFEQNDASCEGGFDERYLGSVHMLFTKPGCRRSPILPPLDPAPVRP